MAQPIYLKRSASQGNAPTTGQLALGEVAINTYDGKVFIKKDDGAEAIVEVGPVYSVNSQTGPVTLDADDIEDASTNHKFASASQLNFLDSLDTDLGTISVPANTTISAFGATLVDDVDASAARTTLSAASTGAVGSSGITMQSGFLLGRGTAATGSIEEITLGTNLTLTGTTLDATGGGVNYTFSETAPVSPSEGDEWLEADTGLFYKYVDDGTSTQWVEMTGGLGISESGSTDWASITGAPTDLSGYGITDAASSGAVGSSGLTMAPDRVLGRSTAGTGAIEELTPDNLVAVLGQATSKTGTGNVVLASSPTLTTPNIGVPSAGTLTNCTGLPISTGISGLGANVATFLATPTAANLNSALSGDGVVVSATSGRISYGTTAPSSPTTGDIWVDTN